MRSSPTRPARRVLHLAVVGLAATVLASCSSDRPTPPQAGDAPGSAAAPSGSPAMGGPGDTAPGLGSVGTPAVDAAPLTLALAGDVHFEGALAGVPGRTGATMGPMSRVLRRADLAVANLESAVTTRGVPAAKEREVASDRYWFRSPPAALGVLARSGVDVASVANNHGADYGVTGIRDTVRAGERGPLPLVGVGLGADQAFTPYRATVRGTDVAVHAADASPRESGDATWAVSPGSGPGIAAAHGGAAQLVAAVRASAQADDLVVVYVHWGEEGSSCSTAPQQDLAETLARAGADVVVGTHAHVPVGAGLLGDTYVSYGLGNFFWYHGRTAETGVLEVTVRGDQVVDDAWVPATIPIGGGAPQPLTGAAAAGAVDDWRSLRACTDLEPGPGAARDGGAALPDFDATVRPLDAAQRARIRAVSPPSCPVPLADLRHLGLTYVGFDGRAHRGELVVAADVAEDVVVAFAALYESRFPIRRMRLTDAYGGDDDRSMAANNTSAYNCRRVAGSTSWSDHAYGRAIDLNPVQNPYVLGDDVRPPAARPFVDVDRGAGAEVPPGVIREGDAVRRAFDRIGWSWGGFYSDPDYQHFSAP